MTSDVLKAIDAGCSMHLSKPFSKESFLSMLQKFLGAASPQISPLSCAPIKSRRAESDEDTIPLVLDFISHLPTKVRELRSALDANNLPSLTALAHKLRGSSGLYGYPDLCELCGELEKRSKAADAAPLSALLEKIEALVPAIEAGRPASPGQPAHS